MEKTLKKLFPQKYSLRQGTPAGEAKTAAGGAAGLM
jgi:hypothetical protein